MSDKEPFDLEHHDPVPDNVTLACRLWDALRCLAADGRGRREWTDLVAHSVAELCPDGLYVYGKQWSKDGRREYLVDQCWRQRYLGRKGTHFIPGAVRFAMECEWIVKPNEQVYDFLKLLDVRADTALYVAGLSKWNREPEAVATCAILAKMHRSFHGQLVLYFFDRKRPAENFKCWHFSRAMDSSDLDGPYQVHEFIEAGRCESIPKRRW